MAQEQQASAGVGGPLSLQDFMSTDNDVRQQAEQKFDAIDSAQKLHFLLSCYSTQNQPDHQRLLTMVLLRRLITSDFEKFYPALPAEFQQQLKDHLLGAIEAEASLQVRSRICECTAELAKNIMMTDGMNSQWPQLQERMIQWAGHSNEGCRHAALHIFSDFPTVFGDQPSTVQMIKSMLHATLQTTDTISVRIEAAKGVNAFLRSDIMDTPEKQNSFSDLIPLIVQLLVDIKNTEEDDTVLEVLTELAESSPKIIRPCLGALLDVSLAYIMDEENTLESRRNLCLELIVTLCESAPAMMRKFGQRHLEALMPLILKMMATIEDDRSWDTNDKSDADDAENDSPSVVGESSLDRLAVALGGKTLLPSAMSVITPLLNSANWMERHAGLMAISSIGEGCKKQMTPMLEQIVGGVLNFITDSHPRVRYAAINCLGQMANDFAPTFEKNFHATVLPRLCEILGDNSHPRVQAHAGAALVNFFEECPKKIIVQYLPTVAPPLANTLQNKMNELATHGVKLVLEQVLVTTSAFAESCGEDFIPYYDSFVPSLKIIIQNANSKELELLRGKAIESISLIGIAVGKDRFQEDAAGVMEILLQSQLTNTLAEDSPILSYMIYGWMRLCKILGNNFEKYLPFVMPAVMKTAALKPQMTFLDEDQVPEEGNDEWTYLPYDDHKSLGIRTAGLEEKETAFEMLLCYAKELKQGFVAYVPEVLKVAVPALKFYFHEGVRISAAACIPELLSCAQANNQNVMEMWQFAVPEIFAALEEETELEVIPELIDCLASCVSIVGSAGLTEKMVKDMMEHVVKRLNHHFERDEERHNVRQDEDYDEDVEDKLKIEGEEDAYMLTRIEELIRQLCKALQANMIPFLDEIVPMFGRLVHPERPVADIQWALCFYDDITECIGELAGVRYKDVFLDPLITYLVHPSAEIRQAAAYGVGIIAKFGGDELTPYLTKALPSLCQIIAHADSRTQDNVVATENAISAVAKVIMHRPAAVPNMDELVRLYIQWLPITEDDEETGPCFELVCNLMEQNHPAVVGDNLAHIVKCMAEVFACKSLDKASPVGQRCVALLQTIQANQAFFQACVSQLTEVQQEGLKHALS